MLLATLLSLASETSLPSTSRVRLSAGLNGANDTAMRIKLNSSAGFLPVSASNSFRASCKLSAFHSFTADSFSIAFLSNSSISASLIFFKNLLFTISSTFISGSAKKYFVISRRSDNVFNRS